MGARSAEGIILRVDDDGRPFEVSYYFEWSKGYALRFARVEARKGRVKRKLNLTYDKGSKNNTVIDLWPTPLTNTFAVKKLKLSIGESREIEVLWIQAPSLKKKKVRQRYTRLKKDVYLFEDLGTKYKAEILFGRDGYVDYYRGLFKRLK